MHHRRDLQGRLWAEEVRWRGLQMRGIGIDIVEVQRIDRILGRRPGFAAMVFSDGERRFCEAQRRPARHFAARFAAKEAFLKALGNGLFDGVALRDIEVVVGPRGAPRLRLGKSAAAALGAAAGAPWVTLTQARGLAAATVVLP